MPVKVIVNRQKVEAKIEYSIKNGLGILSNEILNDCNEYCKMDTGALIASSYIHSKLDEGKLIWQTPYARRQYYEIKTAFPDPNPNATMKWCEAAKVAHMAEWEQKAQRIMGSS